MASRSSQQPGLSSLGLQDRLLEVAVVVGMDEETGLHVRNMNRSTEGSAEELSLFETHFQGHLLDILSGPQDATGESSSWKLSLKIPKKPNKPEPAKHLKRAVSVRQLRKKANKHEEVPVSTDFLSNMPSLCLPGDSKVYSTQPKPRIHSTVLTDIGGDRHYASILTFYNQYFAIKGKDNTWNLSLKEKSHSSHAETNGDGSSIVQVCYVPCCVCFVSLKPYFTVLKDTLSCFYKDLSLSDNGLFRKILEKYVTNLSVVVCPPSFIKVKFNIVTLPIVLLPPDNPVKTDQIVDIDLRLPLLIFKKHPATLLNVLECIMHEQRIVFFSSDYSLLPLVMECFRSYIRPMEWHHQYISILFSEIMGFVDCPGIFMMGCHSSHKSEIEKIENDLFLVDLDNAKIYTTSHSTTKSNEDLMGQFALRMPELAASNLLRRLGELELHNTVSSVCEVSPVSLEEMKEQNMRFQASINKAIQGIFTEFMVDIFGSTLQYLDHEHQQFRLNKFLESIPHTDSPFYIKVAKSYMFRRFVKQRLAQRTDDFSYLAQSRLKRRTVSRGTRRVRMNTVGSPNSNEWEWDLIDKNESIQNKSSFDDPEDIFSDPNLQSDYFADHDTGQRSTPRQYSSETSEIENSSANDICVTIPCFPVQGTNFNSKHFYQRCVGNISNVLEKVNADTKISQSRRSSLRAGLLLLRGFYSLAAENLVAGFRDLQATAKEDARFYPNSTLKKIHSTLNEHELKLLQQNALCTNVPSRKVAATRTQSNMSISMRSYFTDDNVALYPLEVEPFTFMLERNDVTNNEKVISLLYEALCDCSASQKVDHECFNAFFQTWQQLKNECTKTMKKLSTEVRLQPDLVTRRMSDAYGGNDKYLTFHPDEKILKISGIELSSKGNGRLVLTTRRLIFIGAGNEECKLVILLNQILSVKEGKMKNFLSSSVAVHIHYQNTPSESNAPFKIGLKLNCGIWLALINEMKTGQSISREQRDDNITLNTAAQNVVVADAFYAATNDEELMKPDKALEWVNKLCRFESLRQSGELKMFSLETQEKVVMRMDPSPKASKKPGVCAMSYSSGGIDETPHVWVALASGQVRSIDTTSWTLDPQPIKDWDANMICLCVVEGKELWMGSEDTTIYILSISTKKTTRILNDHIAPVKAIANTEDNSVASASLTGEVIIWTLEPTKIHYKFNAFTDGSNLTSFVPFKSYLCCCSAQYIIICNHEGKRLQRLELGQFSAVPLNPNLTCCSWGYNEDNEIWAGDSNGAIYLWDVSSLGSRRTSSLTSFSKVKDINVLKPKLSGMMSAGLAITCMNNCNKKLWLGNGRGEIMIYNTSEQKQESTLKAHDGPVTSMCQLENRYMVSGSGGDDGKMVVWRQ
ncbi:DENN domain-containing protein 3-like isoform X2 [Styela clava]